MIVRDRDYLLDKYGLIFKVIGDIHPKEHYLGYVKYYPNKKGDRVFRGTKYKHNTVVSKSFGLLADHPEYFLYSDLLGCVITGIPRENVVEHFCTKSALSKIYSSSENLDDTPVRRSLRKIINKIFEDNLQDNFGITGSILVECDNSKSDIDMVCFGEKGSKYAQLLFNNKEIIQPYYGLNEAELYKRRAKYMSGNNFNLLLKQEKRKIQGLAQVSKVHVNCEPLLDDPGKSYFKDSLIKEIGEIELIAKITKHDLGLVTPSCYGIEVDSILFSTVEDIENISKRISLLISYLGAYTRAFRKGDKVHLSAKLVHIQKNQESLFGVELTPWSHGIKYSANLIS